MFKIVAKILLATLLSLFAFSASAQIPMSSKYDFQNNVQISSDTFTLYTNSTVPSDSAFVIIDSANNRVRFLDFSAVGGSSFVDSTRLARDSVLIFWQNGVKVDSATIKSTDKYLTLVRDSVLISWRNGVKVDSSTISGLGVTDTDWLNNGSVIYNNVNPVIVNNDTVSNTAKFEVWGYNSDSIEYTNNQLTDTSQILEKNTGSINNTFKTVWSFDNPSDTLFYKASASTPAGVTIPSTNGANARVTILNVNRPISSYLIQVSDGLPYQWRFKGSNDTLAGWDILDTQTGRDTTYWKANASTLDSVKVYKFNNAKTYQYYRLEFDSTVGVSDNVVYVADGSFASNTVDLVNLRLFPAKKIPAFQVFQDYRVQVKSDLYVEGNTKIRESVRAGILFDTLSNTANDTSITLNFTNNQGTHLYLIDTLVTGVLIDVNTSSLEVGYIQDFSLTIEVDTSVIAPTLFFTSGKFQFSGGTTPTLSTGNTDATRKDILTFRYDGTAEKRLKVIPVKDFQNN